MILITGGTGFIGKAVVRQLVESGIGMRLLIRPSKQSPALPRGVAVEVAVSSLTDLRGLRSAMVGVDTVIHLAGSEQYGARGNLMAVDIQGTQAVARAAQEAGVERIFYISHLGADRASAYPVLKAKAIAEEHIRHSKVDYTILRTAVVYGLGDYFTGGLARLVAATPFVFLVPDDGRVLLQPLWVEDLATCLTWSLFDDNTRNQTYSIGGPEYLSFNQILGCVMETIGIQRRLLHVAPPYLRILTIFLAGLFPGLPISSYWLDYLAVNRTCSLDTVIRSFNLMPARFHQNLDYLSSQDWRKGLLRAMLRRR
ncbi:MAG: NAD(P)H-binding protein [Anaerolineales bacterium]|nr:NAD(P)H-binding protein [Anaerolineales bacterium]